MDFCYTKERLSLIENINGKIKDLKSKTMDIVYSYEKNNNKNLLDDIKELQKELEKYNDSINEKKMYTLSIPIIIFMFTVFCSIMDDYNKKISCINSLNTFYNSLISNINNS